VADKVLVGKVRQDEDGTASMELNRVRVGRGRGKGVQSNKTLGAGR